MDPAVSGFIAWLTGLEGAPPPLSWIGGFFIIGGIFYVTIGEYMRKMQDEGSPVPPWIQTLDLSYWLGRCMKFSRGYETMSQMPSSRDDDSRRGLGELEAMEVDVEMSQSVHSLRRHSISLSLSDPMGDKAVISTEQPINDMDVAIASISAPVPEILLEGQPSAPDGGTLMGVAVRRRLSDAVPPTVDELAY